MSGGERRPGEETNKWEEAPETPGEAFCQVWRALWRLVQPPRLSHRGSVYMQRYRLEHARPSQLTHTHWTLSALESSGMHVHTSSSQRIALVFVL